MDPDEEDHDATAEMNIFKEISREATHDHTYTHSLFLLTFILKSSTVCICISIYIHT